MFKHLYTISSSINFKYYTISIYSFTLIINFKLKISIQCYIISRFYFWK